MSGKIFFIPFFVYVLKKFLVRLCPKKKWGREENFNHEKKFSPPKIKYVPPPL
jgi:hypothetical protein